MTGNVNGIILPGTKEGKWKVDLSFDNLQLDDLTFMLLSVSYIAANLCTASA